MARKWVLLTAALAALAFALPAWAASPEAPSDRLTIPQIRMPGPGIVDAFASVVDERANPVGGLGPANFAVALDGRPVSSFSARPVEEGERGVSVVLAIDCSGSMQAEGKIRAAREAASAFIQKLRPQDYGVLMAFGDNVRWLVEDFTNDKTRLLAALVNLEARDTHTVLNEAFFRAAEKGGAAPTPQVAAVVLTDGYDARSSISLDQAVRQAQQRSVPVYALGFGREVSREALTQIATLTGGRFFPVSDAGQLAGFYLALLRQLSNQYLLELHADHAASGEHRLRIEAHYRGSVLAQERSFQIQVGAPAPAVPRPPGKGLFGGHPWWIAGGVLAVCAAAFLGWRLLARGRKISSGEPLKCIYCGGPLQPGDEFYCSNCRARQPSDPVPPPVDTPHVEPPTPPLPPPEPPPPEVPASPWLEVADGRRVVLDGGELKIGRGSGQDLIVGAEPPDRRVSREHARIGTDAHGRFVLTDAQSAGGTFLNDRRIAIPEVLQDGDRIGLGSEESSLVFHDPRRAASASR